jgi:phosphoglycolate phosphatase-like HAD superfamily hydrolase
VWNRSRGLLIFDLDGTLFNSETVTIPAVRSCFEQRGIPVPPDEVIFDFFGRPAGEFHDWVRSMTSADSASELVTAVSSKELEMIPVTGKLYPGVREILAELRVSVDSMAICSNGTEEYVPHVLAVHGIRDYFDAVSYKGDSKDDKPQMVYKLLEQFSICPAVVIGDRRDDIEAAHRNGLKAVAAEYGYGTLEEITSADAIAASPSDLPGIILPFLIGSRGQE